MKLDKQSWTRLSLAIEGQGLAIQRKSVQLGYNVEESIKNGGSESLIGMIIELESTLRVLKRRLEESLSSHEKA